MDPHPSPDAARARLAALLARFSARAAGWWTVDAGAGLLVQVVFVPAANLDGATAREFDAMTRSVPLGRTELGIVKAVATGRPAVSLASELAATDGGSGLWLRRFGAERSVAVPIPGPDGAVAAVVSIALRSDPPDDEVAEAVRAAAAGDSPG